ncbi:LysR family transcriptional regulator [Niallia sp. Krafla_26]|uniref:LysR family transcriptional regulator n=1 Tax=Niallia sp. Krafla_26 TaxID=3064703 RepID=UPI003D18032C
MDTSQIETFLAIIEYSNYSRAAESLNVTQPTVTARIKNLETELNCKLFNRDGKNVTLTDEGKVFVEYATSILTYMNHSKEATMTTSKPSLKIGISPGFSYSFISNLIQSVKSIDNLNLKIVEGKDSVSLNEQILAGEFDLVFTRNIVSHKSDLVSEFIFNDRFVLIVGKDHPLAKKEDLSLSDLENETLIWYRRKTALLANVEKQLIGVPNIKHIEVDNSEMQKKVIGSGVGVGITLLLGVDESDDNLVVKNIKALDQLPNKVYVQYRNKLLIDRPIKQIIYSIINHEMSS